MLGTKLSPEVSGDLFNERVRFVLLRSQGWICPENSKCIFLYSLLCSYLLIQY